MRLLAFAFTIVFVWTGPYIYFTLASLDFTFNSLMRHERVKNLAFVFPMAELVRGMGLLLQ